MLSTADVLGIYSELAIGIAGFGGVAAAFSGRERRFMPTELIRLQSLLLSSASVVVGCFAYYVASVGEASEPRAIVAAGVFSLGITVFFSCTIIPRAWRGASDPESTSRVPILWVFTIMTVTILLTYSGTIALGGAPALLLTGFSSQLTFALWMIARLLTRPN